MKPFSPAFKAWTTVCYFLLQATPLLGQTGLVTGNALISSGSLTYDGTSRFRVYWAPAIARGNIRVPDLEFSSSTKTLTAGTECPVAGTYMEYLGATFTDGGMPMMDAWTSWRCGGYLVSNNSTGTLTYEDSLFGQGGPPGVSDFFTQVVTGALNSSGYGISDVHLHGRWMVAGTHMNNGDLRGLYSSTLNTSGALVQNSPLVVQEVGLLMNQLLDYDYWKQFAIDRNRYARPQMHASGNGTIVRYTNQFGMNLYINSFRQLTTVATGNTPFTKLYQLSMKNEVTAAGGNTHRNDHLVISDDCLFIDSPNFDETYSGPIPAHDMGSDFFWKGLLYINGNLSAVTGGVAPSVLMKSPEQFDQDRHGSTGTTVANCMLDGMLKLNGSFVNVGNRTIYGALASTADILDAAKTPAMFYNSRFQFGILVAPAISVEMTRFAVD